MKLLVRSVVVATIAIGVFLGAVSAIEEEYEGASFCRDYPAWPNGTYLGQMHPYHSSFYTGYAERRGWNPCETWANDQRNSAIRGLRELGYTVTEPDAPAPTPEPTPAPTLDLATTDKAQIWIRLFNTDFGRLEGQALVHDWEFVGRYSLGVSLFAGADNVGNLCNNKAIFGGEWSSNLGCIREYVPHATLTRVNVSVARTNHYRCALNDASTPSQSIFACERR